MTHQHPSGQRNMYYDGANAGGGTVTAPFTPPVNAITIGRSHTWPWKGMIDGEAERGSGPGLETIAAVSMQGISIAHEPFLPSLTVSFFFFS